MAISGRCAFPKVPFWKRELAIYRLIETGIRVGEQLMGFECPRWPLYVNLAARGNGVVERLKSTALRQIGLSSQFVDRNRFHSVACVQEVINATDFVAYKGEHDEVGWLS